MIFLKCVLYPLMFVLMIIIFALLSPIEMLLIFILHEAARLMNMMKEDLTEDINKIIGDK